MERLFLIIQFATITIFFLIGAALYRMGTADMLLESRTREAIQTTFVMDEPKPEMKKEPPRPKPVERKIDDTPVEPVKKAEPEPVRQEQRQVRQVYGLRKVYSQGLGDGGDAQDAIVGRLGNTLDRNADTSAATADDLKPSRPAAAAPPPPAPSAEVVTKPPRLEARFRRLKPQYSPEMLQNRVEGVVKARLLIGPDGAVRRVEITEDIGYDSAEIAREFLMGLRFAPATRGEETVSVWIPFSIRFELI